METKKHIPNLLTAGNLFSGCVGIVFELKGFHDTAVFLMLAGLFFDFFDGFAARMLKVSSDIGKELDSLADMVTFGVLPSTMMYNYMTASSCQPGVCTGLISTPYFPFLAFIIAVFSGFRLAKFNIDTRQSDRFLGLPTPANAIFIATLSYAGQSNFLINEIFQTPKILLILTFFLCWLLVSEIPLIALKFKSFNFKENAFKFILVISAIALVAVFKLGGIPYIILLYIVLSLIENAFDKNIENE